MVAPVFFIEICVVFLILASIHAWPTSSVCKQHYMFYKEVSNGTHFTMDPVGRDVDWDVITKLDPNIRKDCVIYVTCANKPVCPHTDAITHTLNSNETSKLEERIEDDVVILNATDTNMTMARMSVVDEDDRQHTAAVVVGTTAGAFVGTTVMYFLAREIRNMLQSNIYRL